MAAVEGATPGSPIPPIGFALSSEKTTDTVGDSRMVIGAYGANDAFETWPLSNVMTSRRVALGVHWGHLRVFLRDQGTPADSPRFTGGRFLIDCHVWSRPRVFS